MLDIICVGVKIYMLYDCCFYEKESKDSFMNFMVWVLVVECVYDEL